MRLFNYTFEESQCLGVKCLNYPNILFYANHKKPQKFLVNFCGFVFNLDRKQFR